MSERRQHFRRRTLLDGRLEIAKLNGWRLDCSVRNLSAGGAKVEVTGGVIVPQNVAMSVSGKPQRPARLVWHRDGQAGFALDGARGDDQAFADASCDARQAVRQPATAPQDRFASRVAAIAERRPPGHFTRP